MAQNREVVVAATWIHHSGDAVLAVRPRGLDVFFLPGGVPEPDETYAEAVVREVMEEVGLRLEASELREVVQLDDDAYGRDDVTVRMICFEGPAAGTPMPDGDEIEELAWLPPSQWHRFAPPVQRALAAARDKLERLQFDKLLASTAGIADDKITRSCRPGASINEWVRPGERSRKRSDLTGCQRGTEAHEPPPDNRGKRPTPAPELVTIKRMQGGAVPYRPFGRYRSAGWFVVGDQWPIRLPAYLPCPGPTPAPVRRPSSSAACPGGDTHAPALGRTPTTSFLSPRGP